MGDGQAFPPKARRDREAFSVPLRILLNMPRFSEGISVKILPPKQKGWDWAAPALTGMPQAHTGLKSHGRMYRLVEIGMNPFKHKSFDFHPVCGRKSEWPLQRR